MVGLKNGHMLIVDIASGDVLEDIPAHDKELWSVCLLPDQVLFIVSIIKISEMCLKNSG
jgi:hypothetical protein